MQTEQVVTQKWKLEMAKLKTENSKCANWDMKMQTKHLRCDCELQMGNWGVESEVVNTESKRCKLQKWKWTLLTDN